MAYDTSLAALCREQLQRQPGIVEKKMFGGLGFLLNGNMCIGVWKDCLIIRAGLERYEAFLEEPHTRPFDITGKAMRGWLMVEPPGVAEDAALRTWVNRAVEFVGGLPPK